MTDKLVETARQGGAAIDELVRQRDTATHAMNEARLTINTLTERVNAAEHELARERALRNLYQDNYVTLLAKLGHIGMTITDAIEQSRNAALSHQRIEPPKPAGAGVDQLQQLADTLRTSDTPQPPQPTQLPAFLPHDRRIPPQDRGDRK